jgi:(E)-4-hydroxy-3-methylbut-2-enyl-diphosphate synthase
MSIDLKYCNSITEYKRFPSHEVQIGNIKMGGEHPVLVQSMVNTSTMDTEATVKQVKSLVAVGCKMVRITAPGVKEAENLRNIKNQLLADGINVPLVADIHFAPKAADIAATIVEKVRINPGNYVDKKVFKTRDYTDADYQEELLKIEEKFVPFLNICKEHQTAVRIGSNHGSLSDRIVNKYGNTPEGMVEAAMEFLRICQKQDFKNVVVSMKASNTQVMMQSNRLLAAKMLDEGMSFPIHLGVTEAGGGEDARVKSSIGIGALLADGIGDTIRVSLTESPMAEIPVAQTIVDYYTEIHKKSTGLEHLSSNALYNPYQYQRRFSEDLALIGASNKPIVIAKSLADNITWQGEKPDFIYSEKASKLEENQSYIFPFQEFDKYRDKENCFPLLTTNEFLELEKPIEGLCFVESSVNNIGEVLDKLESSKVVLILESQMPNAVAEQRAFFNNIKQLKTPVVLKKTYTSAEDLAIKAACDFGPMFIDGLGDGLWIESKKEVSFNVNLAFNLLQGSRVRMSKTEFISCPSCGRTLFDLEKTTENIKSRLSHLKELKIGVMGCIVNGPGEMADADYGYVGSGRGKVSLYKGQQVIRRNIPSEEAVDELINIIKDNGDWKEV